MLKDESGRIEAVHKFLNLKSNKDKELQEIVGLASDICHSPLALITLIDEEVQHIRFKVGTTLEQTAREDSFCQYVIDKEDLLIIPDATLDIRFSNIPFVVNDPKIRFYAGAPLITYEGQTLGSLCVLDTKPRKLNRSQKTLLGILSKRIVQIMEFEFMVDILKKQYFEAKDAEIKLRSFFDSSGACHLLLGMDTEVLAFNKNMAAFVAKMYHTELLAGMKIDEILKDKPLDSFISDYQEVLEGKLVSFEREYQYQDDEIIWLYVTFEAAYNPEHEIIGMSYNATDITQRKLNERQILEQNESLKQIAYMQSHELRRPVASILGLMELFKENDYQATVEELKLMQQATEELDAKIRTIVNVVSV
jgi:PAS domain S-box-containing protein